MKRSYLILGMVLLSGLVGAAQAQQPERQWISLDGSAPGTPPTIELQENLSGFQRSTFRIELHGFFLQTVTNEQGTFQKVVMPGSGAVRLLGKPTLPELRLPLAIPTTAESLTVEQVNVLSSRVFENIRAFPSQPGLWETGNEQPLAAEFVIDTEFYQTSQPFPAGRARVHGSKQLWRNIHVQTGIVLPFSVVPAEDRLIVQSEMVVTFGHEGTLLPPVEVSPVAVANLYRMLLNLLALHGWVFGEPIDFHGCYLFLVDPLYYEETLRLAWHRARMGYEVTVWTTDDIGGTDCETLRDAVKSWAADCEHSYDRYVALIGEHDDPGMCYTGRWSEDDDTGEITYHFSDYRIGVLDDGYEDVYQDVGVGRLSVDSEADLAEQIDKIIAYETSPPAMADYYGDVVLAAHPEEGRDYIEACQEVVTYPDYDFPLDFTERYGDRSDGTVDNVIDDIDDGKGIVVYRGHGGSGTWSGWDCYGRSLWSSQVDDFTNGSQTSVVFSIACMNNAIDEADDSIGETWMEEPTNGAVFHYSSTRGSNTRHNNELLPWIFRVLFDDADPNLWEVVQGAQGSARCLASCSIEASEKTWMQYLILGLPDTKVYREAPYDLLMTRIPVDLAIGPQHLNLLVQDEKGKPVEGAIVSGAANGRCLFSRYTNAAGEVDIVVELADVGEFALTARTAHDNALMCSTTIPVKAVAHAVGPATATGLTTVCSPNPLNPRTVIGFELPRQGHLTLKIYNLQGQLVRTLVDEVVPAGPGSAIWDGSDASGRPSAAGVYFYEAAACGERKIEKITVVK